MAFREDQLITWANQGTTTSSANTYNSIKTCIEGNNWKDDITFDIYLQGSYKNTTNIRGDSDVDVIIEFRSVFYSNSNELPSEQLEEYNEYYSDGKYTLNSFKNAVIGRLKDYYGESYVEVGNKSITVVANSGRLDCDIICCAQYREYRSFSKTNIRDYAKGIVFWTNKTDEKIVNFPSIHYDNGVSKNRNCASNYKPVVRIIKNMKLRLIESNAISKSLTPSYFVECLMYNAPNSNYNNSTYYSRVLSVLNTFHDYSNTDLEKLVCQNEQRYLFGNSDQQWNISDCSTFISKLIDFWNEG